MLDEHFRQQVESVKDLILSEVNVKNLEILTDTAGILVKKIKPDFKKLGPKYGNAHEAGGFCYRSVQSGQILPKSKSPVNICLNMKAKRSRSFWLMLKSFQKTYPDGLFRMQEI